MEKKLLYFKVDYQLDWEDEVSIEKLEKDIKAMKKLGVTEVNIYTVFDSITIRPIKSRVETDEEYKLRITEEKRELDNPPRESFLKPTEWLDLD